MRERMIEAVRDRFLGDQRVYAAWLEGADGLGRVDEYSDIDLWLDVEDGQEQRVLEECGELLGSLSPLDYVDRLEHEHPKIQQWYLHLSGTSEYLIVDLCVQSHSRGHEGTTYVEGDIAELPLVLFDKGDVIRMIAEPTPDEGSVRSGFEDAMMRFAQRPRMTKYLDRRQYLEARAYYDRYVCEPVVQLLRLVHTPRHWEYGLVHISHHLPGAVVEELERLYQVGSLAEMEANLDRADRLFRGAEEELRRRFSFLEGISQRGGGTL